MSARARGSAARTTTRPRTSRCSWAPRGNGWSSCSPSTRPSRPASCPRSGWCRRRGAGSPSQAIGEVAEVLGLTPAYVKGVVTFYTMYHTHPVGRHFIQVCTTSPCNICGAEEVVKALLEETGCGELGATSPDGRFTVIEVECLGACGFATPILVDDDFIESVTPGEGAGNPAEVRVMGYPHPQPPQRRRWSSRSTSAIPRRGPTPEGGKRGGYEG